MAGRALVLVVAVAAIVLAGFVIDRAASPDGEQVVVLGDSITALGTAQMNASLGGDFKLTINGKFGATAAERESAAKLLGDTNPKQVIINLGTNDVLQHVPTQQSVAALEQIIGDFGSASCIHLVTINTHLNQDGNQPRALAEALNRSLQQFADHDHDIDVVDWNAIDAATVDQAHPLGLTFDGVHPTPTGQAKLVAAYGHALQRCGRPWHFW